MERLKDHDPIATCSYCQAILRAIIEDNDNTRKEYGVNELIRLVQKKERMNRNTALKHMHELINESYLIDMSFGHVEYVLAQMKIEEHHGELEIHTKYLLMNTLYKMLREKRALMWNPIKTHLKS